MLLNIFFSETLLLLNKLLEVTFYRFTSMHSTFLLVNNGKRTICLPSVSKTSIKKSAIKLCRNEKSIFTFCQFWRKEKSNKYKEASPIHSPTNELIVMEHIRSELIVNMVSQEFFLISTPLVQKPWIMEMVLQLGTIFNTFVFQSYIQFWTVGYITNWRCNIQKVFKFFFWI